jgi:hypothetical protein
MITFIASREAALRSRGRIQMGLNRFSQSVREAIEVAGATVRRGQENQLSENPSYTG